MSARRTADMRENSTACAVGQGSTEILSKGQALGLSCPLRMTFKEMKQSKQQYVAVLLT